MSKINKVRQTQLAAKGLFKSEKPEQASSGNSDLLTCPTCDGLASATAEFSEITQMLNALIDEDVSEIEMIKNSILNEMNIPKTRRRFYMKALDSFQEKLCSAR